MADNTDIYSAITDAATRNGIDPNWALAVAEREGTNPKTGLIDPESKNDKSIYGIFQMTKNLRNLYGSGDSNDPAVQAEGFMKYVNGEIRPQMKSVLGRDPTSDEMYLGHHFGPVRAAKMIASGHPETPVGDVFTQHERSLNPHFDKAGTTGNLMSSINSDMGGRYAKFSGGARPNVAGTTAANTSATPFDYSAFGTPVATGDLKMAANPAAEAPAKQAMAAPAEEDDDGAPKLQQQPPLTQPKPITISPPPKVSVAPSGVPMPKLPALSKSSFGLPPQKVLAARPDELAPGLSLLMGQAS